MAEPGANDVHAEKLQNIAEQASAVRKQALAEINGLRRRMQAMHLDHYRLWLDVRYLATHNMSEEVQNAFKLIFADHERPEFPL